MQQSGEKGRAFVRGITESLKGVASAAAEGAVQRAGEELRGHVESLEDVITQGAQRARDFFQTRSTSGRKKREQADVDVRVVGEEPRGRRP